MSSQTPQHSNFGSAVPTVWDEIAGFMESPKPSVIGGCPVLPVGGNQTCGQVLIWILSATKQLVKTEEHGAGTPSAHQIHSRRDAYTHQELLASDEKRCVEVPSEGA
jgi:hypothetical protein